jgi:signal transduction histidine kinase
MLTSAPRRTAAATAAGAAVALAGAGAVVAQLGVRAPSPELGAAALAALFGVTLMALAGATSGEGLYAGIVDRIAPGRRWVWPLRVAVVATAPLAGAGVVAYAAAALVLTVTAPLVPNPPLDWRRTAGSGLAALAVVLGADAAGLTLVGPVVLWAILLVAAGLALFWGAAGVRYLESEAALGEDTTVRTGLGLMLAVAGVLYVLSQSVHLPHVGSTAAGTSVCLAVLVLVAGPWWLRTRRLLAAERIDRARAQERAEMADHLHDSVLQTLALIQRRADDPAAMASLAHRQERDLRDWLLGRRPSVDAATFADALRAVAAGVEDAHQTELELVIVGDAAVDADVQALLAATREALVNAARHAAGSEVSVYARAQPSDVTVYIRDRGPGFDPAGVPEERRGIRESIEGRMRRHGGTAEIVSAPGTGCEVILSLPR